MASWFTARAAQAGVPIPSLYNDGRRWIGVDATSTCAAAPPGWLVAPLFATASSLPAPLGQLCLYTWATRGTVPAMADLVRLFDLIGVSDLAEDVPVLYPSSGPSAPDVALFAGMHDAFLAQVGTAALLTTPLPLVPRVRVAVIDTAPDAPNGAIEPGASRHGDTLAHLIEDIVCLPVAPKETGRCAAEVTTELALPWIWRDEPGINGGFVGTLADLSMAIERAVVRWQKELASDPRTTPDHLILNLSVGWEHTPTVADCTLGGGAPIGTPARAVQGILQYAASLGVLVIASAGNDPGGATNPPSNLSCPGLYQGMPQTAHPSQSLVVAVSGVDYHGDPLATARPQGLTGIVGLGLGGVAWRAADPVPPALTGASVATAVVSAVSAVVWAVHSTQDTSWVTGKLYLGGTPRPPTANSCPLSTTPCQSRMVSMCGALKAASSAQSCALPGLSGTGSPALPNQIAALFATYAATPQQLGAPVLNPAVSSIPRHQESGLSAEPWVFPTPVSETCPKCVVRVVPQSQGPNNATLVMPPRDQPLGNAMLVIRNGTQPLESAAVALGDITNGGSYVFSIAPVLRAVYLTGIEIRDGTPASITEQLFLAQ